jgi:hypothetical protein
VGAGFGADDLGALLPPSPSDSVDFTLSCPTTSFCVGADVSGALETTGQPLSRTRTWSPFTVIDPRTGEEAQVTAVSCPSVSFCTGATRVAGS